MGGINVGGGGGGKKSVDSEVPLVPFIDLLLCCIMFLLVTAVWNQLARINATQQTPGENAPLDQPPPDEKVKLYLRINDEGYTLESTAGDKVMVPKEKGEYNLRALEEKLAERHKLEPDRKDIIVAPVDGVSYQEIVKAMDTAVGQEFPQVSVRDGATVMSPSADGAAEAPPS